MHVRMTDRLDKRGDAGGVRKHASRDQDAIRVLPTSGLIRYMTTTLKSAKRIAQVTTDKAGSVDKLRWLYAARACAPGSGPIKPQTGMIRPI